MNMSSVLSRSDRYRGDIQQRFRNPKDLEDLETLIANYEVSVSSSRVQHGASEGRNA